MNLAAVSRRFSEALANADEIIAKQFTKDGAYGLAKFVDANEYTKWTTRARQFIVSVCGGSSEYFKMLERAEKPSMMSTNLEHLERMRSVISAAAEDFNAGYLTSFRNMVQAEVFSDELEQAEALFAAGYILPAAVIAGSVLETQLRQMCVDYKIDYSDQSTRPSLNRMNDDLARFSAYNANVKKQVTWMSSVRNSAAHGLSSEFNADDVRNLLSGVSAFLANQN